MRKWRTLLLILFGISVIIGIRRSIQYSELLKQPIYHRFPMAPKDNLSLSPIVPLPGPNAPLPGPPLTPTSDLQPLVAQMGARESWSWIRGRVERLWAQWVKAASRENRRGDVGRHRRLKVLVVPGILTTQFAARRSTDHGGPLGDFLMWADLLAGLHVLGHRVTLLDDIKRANRRMNLMVQNNSTSDFDIIFVDIMAISQFSYRIKKHLSCRFRVLDAYGSEAAYNDPVYSRKHGFNSPWGRLGLHLKQFFTLYPHTPDNSFLGFVVTSAEPREKQKKGQAIIYGKDPVYLTPAVHNPYLRTISSYVPLYATMSSTDRLPAEVTNLGILDPAAYNELLGKATLLVGLGNPLESSGAMEALARGCVFLNPRFKGRRRNVLSSRIYRKPTSRQMSSQVPYLETSVGPPYVYTVDTGNTSEVIQALTDIMDHGELSPFIPKPFTPQAYLTRLLRTVGQHSYCPEDTSPREQETRDQPPSLSVHLGEDGCSCNDVCEGKGKFCDASSFHRLNNTSTIKSQTSQECTDPCVKADLTAPHMDTVRRVCGLQAKSTLYSCSGGRPGVLRLCPCVDDNLLL